MATRPIVGIATQTLQPIAGQLPLCWIMGQGYVKAHTQAGAVPWVIPLLPEDEGTLRAIYEQLDGVFLAGGVDVHPQHYGEPRQDHCGPHDDARDEVELTLLRWAIADHKPVLGVCRGAQIINVASGGTLYQDLATEFKNDQKHDFFPTAELYSRDMLVHEIMVRPDTRLHRILETPSALVNSMHHQGIKTLADGLVANAFAPDGLVEGVEGANGHFILGIQWHPEELLETRPMRRLFDNFVGEARAFQARRRVFVRPPAPAASPSASAADCLAGAAAN